MDPEQPPTAITPRLYLSGLSSATNPHVLARHKITHILSLLSSPQRINPPPPAPQLPTLLITINDTPSADLLSQLPRIADFIDGALQNEDAVVLVHCMQGKSRSAAAVCAWLMKSEGWTCRRAMREVKGKRACVCLNLGFVRQLGAWEGMLREERKRETERKVLGLGVGVGMGAGLEKGARVGVSKREEGWGWRARWSCFG